MKTYHLDEGLAGTAEDIVRNLHKGSRAQCATDAEWMVETADRCRLQDGGKVRDDTAEHFVDDLISHNLLHLFLGK